MKRKHFFGFAVMTVAVIITLAGCASLAEMFKGPEFSSGFTGTWERADQSKFSNTLTFTSTTLKASNQPYHWVIRRVTGDVYSVIIPSNFSYTGSGTITISLKDGSLEIIDREADSTTTGWQNTENDWTGTWKRK
jgi:hypothetical protein